MTELYFDYKSKEVKVCLSLKMCSVSQDIAVAMVAMRYSDYFYTGGLVLNVRKHLQIYLQ